MTGFLGLRSECFAFEIHDHDEKYKTCKGTIKNTVKIKIRYGDCNQVVETNEVITRSFTSFRSKSHKIHSINSTQESLNSYGRFGDKRYWTTSVDSLAYVHVRRINPSGLQWYGSRF